MQNTDLKYILQDIYYGGTNERRGLLKGSLSSDSLYMEVPINSAQFEIPVFLFESFCKALLQIHDCEEIVVNLYHKGYYPKYRTVSRFMQDVLRANFNTSRLIKINVMQKDALVTYYATHGAVFDSQFHPVMMMSWLIEKIQSSENEVRAYKILRPLLRVEPTCLLEPNDSIRKYIIRNIIPCTLEEAKFHPLYSSLSEPYFVEQDPSFTYPVKVEIDHSQFVLKTASPPSISTSDAELFKAAEGHINEILQYSE